MICTNPTGNNGHSAEQSHKRHIHPIAMRGCMRRVLCRSHTTQHGGVLAQSTTTVVCHRSGGCAQGHTAAVRAPSCRIALSATSPWSHDARDQLYRASTRQRCRATAILDSVTIKRSSRRRVRTIRDTAPRCNTMLRFYSPMLNRWRCLRIGTISTLATSVAWSTRCSLSSSSSSSSFSTYCSP